MASVDPFTITNGLTELLSSFGNFTSLQGAATGQELNATFADLQAQSVIQQGEQSVAQQQRRSDKIVGSQMLAYAKAGVKFEGSPSDVFLETAKNIRHDMILTRLNASNRANQLGFEALQRRISAGQARTKSIQSIGKGLINIGGSIALDNAASKVSENINDA